MSDRTNPYVVSWGGGLNSTAMVLGLHARGVTPDLILFADTGGEHPETYAYADRFGAWLAANGLPPVTRVSAAVKYPSLERQVLSLGVLPSVAYGWKTCSIRWKAEPQDKYLNNWSPARSAWAAAGRVTKAIGYDADEAHRVKDYDDAKFAVVYPLVEWGWGREECRVAVVAAGLPVPRKSACFFCPHTRKHEVLALRREHPDLYARATAIEAGAEARNTSVAGLGRRWSWRSLAEAADAGQVDAAGRAANSAPRLFPDPPDSPCGCFDGDGDAPADAPVRSLPATPSERTEGM